MDIRAAGIPDRPADRVSPGWKHELLEGGKPVSKLWIFDRDIRLGAATVRVWGISGVKTEPEYHGRGFAREARDAAPALMEKEGYEATLLHGIPDFYHRIG